MQIYFLVSLNLINVYITNNELISPTVPNIKIITSSTGKIVNLSEISYSV